MGEITYRDLQPQDFEALHEMVSIWEVTRQLGSWPWPADPEFTRKRATPFEGDGFVWAICENDRLVGTMGIANGEIGYNLHPRLQGRGIGSAAARRAIDHAFANDPKLAFIRAGTWIDNVPSHRLLLRLGFQHRQTRYLPSVARGLPVQCRSYKLFKANYGSHQSAP